MRWRPVAAADAKQWEKEQGGGYAMPAEYLDVKLKPIVAGINPSCRVVSCRGPRILTTCNALLVTPEPSSSITFFYLHGDDEVDPNNGRGTRFNWNEAGYIQRRYKQGNGMAATELPGMEWDAARGGAAAVERRRRRRLRRRRNPRRQARGVSGRGGEDVSGDACHPPAATARRRKEMEQEEEEEEARQFPWVGPTQHTVVYKVGWAQAIRCGWGWWGR